ncbi:hypothetical protein [Lentibacillus sp. CBA3610]|uniref:hypothetical protein n=1 Tax=Lentibacillus sp. CBA3610 TaxID=2518176 RepID=UPI0015962DD4|nr:hypothetical protein [Lentibacillus sp. CBA3610]QKY70144.1 hypothetical protein Len3610_11585 [Lentibacillus sp. CBA3610]
MSNENHRASGNRGPGRYQGHELAEAMMTTDEMKAKFEQISSYMVPEDGWFVIDKTGAANELTDSEIDVIHQALHVYKIHHLKQDDISIQAIPGAIAAFLGTMAVYVGWELATEVTKSFYRWGMTEACRAWGHIGIIGRFCRANDYV